MVEREIKFMEVPTNVYSVEVESVHHFTDSLFSFRVTRPQGFRFHAGEFVMLGLPSSDRPLYRAYSIASPSWDEGLSFYSIKVDGGPLTENLKQIRAGDEIWLRKKTTGTLVLSTLLPGRRLWMISTGTGIAPFVSLIREPDSYDQFDKLILTQTCRHLKDLDYGREQVAATRSDPLIGDLTSGRLLHFESVTRDAHRNVGRITSFLSSGAVYTALGLPRMNKEEDRVMICGSMGMINDVRGYCEGLGMVEGSHSAPGHFVIERAFVD